MNSYFCSAKNKTVGKNKLRKFAENETFKNMVQAPRTDLLENGLHLKGKWHKEFFKNDRPIVLELGCGKGEYTVGLGKQFPEKNFIGIDIKGARMWRGARTATENKMTNIGFLRTHIELIHNCFAKGEVSEIWITFPDPQIKYKRTKHRLTNPVFLDRYKQILSPSGCVHLKTDSEYMHGYTLGLLQGMGLPIAYANHDVYKNEGSPEEVLGIQTFYENQYLAVGKPITYLRFSFS